jgi:uncharacterized protein YbaP (TraB family)
MHVFILSERNFMAEARRWRLWVRLPKKHFEYFEKYSDELGISMSQLIAMCAWSGARIVIPALDTRAYEALKLIEQDQHDEVLQQQADEYFTLTPEFQYLEAHKEHVKKWIQERGLHNDEK